MSYKIAPSILAADYANFASELARIDVSGAEYVHIDIMDEIGRATSELQSQEAISDGGLWL